MATIDRTPKYRTEIQQMMFVSGETAEPSVETTTIIENIVHQQVSELVTRASDLALRAGSRTISTDHMLYVIRKDKAKVSRVISFLSWKDVRKNVKDSDEKGGGDAGDFNPDEAAPNDPILGAGPGKKTGKKAKLRLPWGVESFYNIQLPEKDDEEDEEEEEMNMATLQRLKQADERTKNMTKEEYVHWSDCRQASFTYRKGKRFREWVGFSAISDAKPSDDVIDILGFLTFEIVQTLTEEALKVKEIEDRVRKESGSGADGANGDKGGDASGSGGAVGDGDGGDGGGQVNPLKRKRESGLFDPPEQARSPVSVKHVREGYRRLQQPEKGRNVLGMAAYPHIKKPLKLI